MAKRAKRAKKAPANVCDPHAGCCCPKGFGIVMLLIGILFLFQDQGWWNFWNFSWYTVVFLLIGLKMLFLMKK